MKRLYIIHLLLALGLVAHSQSPAGVSYQALIRDASGTLVTAETVGVRVSIRQGTEGGSVVYQETNSATTSANGVLHFQLGGGTSNDDISGIDWGAGPYFVEHEVDLEGGTSYTISGTTPLRSVPYSWFTDATEHLNFGVSVQGDTLHTGLGERVVIPGISLGAVEDVPAVYPAGYQHCLPGGDTTEIVDVTNPVTGKTWMDRNLGASRVATDSADVQAYGDLFQWGRFADGHQCRESDTLTTLATTALPSADSAWYRKYILPNSGVDWLVTMDNNLWQGTQGVNNSCPGGYRLPTDSEWDAERLSWSQDNSSGAFASQLKLPVSGNRSSSSGGLLDVGTNGRYWSSSVSGSNARRLRFRSSSAGLGNGRRANGLAVRCLKD